MLNKIVFGMLFGALLFFAGALGTSDLAVSDVYINGSYAYSTVYNGLNDSINTTVVLTVEYVDSAEMYGGEVTLKPGNNTVYAPLRSGYLVNIIGQVDPFDNVSGWSTDKFQILRVNKRIDIDVPAVIVDTYANKSMSDSNWKMIADINDSHLYKYGVKWRIRGEEWKNESFYAAANHEVLNFTHVFHDYGKMEFQVFAYDAYGNYYETGVKTVILFPGNDVNQVAEIVRYSGYPVVWRSYRYNPSTNVTLITTHILSNEDAHVRFVDYIPMTITQGNKYIVVPDPDKTKGRHVQYDLQIPAGEDYTIDYVVYGKVNKELASEWPAPEVFILSNKVVKPSAVTREYVVGNYTIYREWKYIPDLGYTVVTTNIVGLNDSNNYTVTDTLPYSLWKYDRVYVPEPVVSKDESQLSWNVTNATSFGYAIRFVGYVNSSVLDEWNVPQIVGRSGNKTVSGATTELPKSPLTGLFALAREGSVLYAILVTAAFIIAMAFIYVDKRIAQMAAEIPVPTEEDVIANELFSEYGL